MGPIVMVGSGLVVVDGVSMSDCVRVGLFVTVGGGRVGAVGMGSPLLGGAASTQVVEKTRERSANEKNFIVCSGLIEWRAAMGVLKDVQYLPMKFILPARWNLHRLVAPESVPKILNDG